MTRVLLTGATGFVGRNLGSLLAHSPYIVRAALRAPGRPPAGIAEVAAVGDITSQTDWSAALADVDTVIHAAARAHRPNDPAEEPYLEVNARGTGCLARAAARAGVRRFVYLSSIKVNGEGITDRPYRVGDPPRPGDAYASSKWLGEQYLQEVVAASAMQGVVVRAPLVYGPGVKGNFLRLLRWVQAGRPLPLGGIHNMRSLVNVWNLCDLLRLLLEHPLAAGRTWMVSDGEDLSTPELVRRMARAMGRPVRLLTVPRPLLSVVARLTGASAEFARLCGSLTVDISTTRGELGWTPPVAASTGIARTVDWYLTQGQARGS
jgi:nucleoside-diphosphate-sugar epimerase